MPEKSTKGLRDQPLESDRTRWLELLDGLDLDELTARFVESVVGIPGYDPPPVPLSEVRRTGRLSFEGLLDALRAGGLHDTLEVASDVGVSRARAGIPVTSLMSAIRLDFVILWAGLTRVATHEDSELLVRHTGIVLNTVDEYAGQTQRAYVAETQRMRDEAASVRRGLIAALFQDPPPGEERLRDIADELGLDLAEPLVVVAARGDDIAPLRVSIAELERVGAEVFTMHLGDQLIAFLRRDMLPGSRLEESAERIRATTRIGLAVASAGLPELRHAADTARDLARVFKTHETGAMTLTRGWARLAARSLLASGRPILDDVNAALGTCGIAERARLEEAVRSYLRTGSIGESAAELFCHRNTIANRLRRFAELTGVDPLVPTQAARIVVGWS
ncbi:helix-turn-helix domain-containing protein [Leucobacter sp. CSA2]|uniref:Helix-turn-helix domain-containing protein n=1 Tax=Leucobacter edaphi TaxID=2796472 RepID=A0A934QER6_9MICO|nr:helix-turn-helix domain-containing protein [Leucobacter edaphi]MBK0421822.1 helix-turn-helix domain-containing protein [Leucobacter edaphi]